MIVLHTFFEDLFLNELCLWRQMLMEAKDPPKAGVLSSCEPRDVVQGIKLRSLLYTSISIYPFFPIIKMFSSSV